MLKPDPYASASTADRYGPARALPPETMRLWLDAIRDSIPAPDPIRTILDLGCGTGRFSAPLAEEFGCGVIGVDPSEAMLAAAAALCIREDIEWKQGSAERIPLEDSTVDLIFMSQVFHHLRDPEAALREIGRVLRPAGCLVIRNATYENNEAIPWLTCFPEALEIERGRILPRRELDRVVCDRGFELIRQQTVQQIFARSPLEYFEKVRQRGLSSLILIDDQAFEAGLDRFRGWIAERPPDQPIYEPVDLFTFRRSASRAP